MNAAIITARAGSKSLIDKNVFPVEGRPLISYPIQAALDANLVQEVYITTDGANIADVGEQMGCKIIWRPDDLAGDTVNHGLVIKHAVEYADELEEDLDCIVVLLGNTVMVDGALIDKSLTVLSEKKEIDSVMTVWQAADDHPLRSLEIHDGLLRSYGDQDRKVSTERQSYLPAYYYDQGVWAFRKGCVKSEEGPNPWWWMGKRCYPIIRSWITGRDIHSPLEVALAEWWLTNKDGFEFNDE